MLDNWLFSPSVLFCGGGGVQYASVCRLMLRDSSQLWGQLQLNSVGFFHACSSYHLVSLWHWASSQFQLGSVTIFIFSTGSPRCLKPCVLQTCADLSGFFAWVSWDYNHRGTRSSKACVSVWVQALLRSLLCYWQANHAKNDLHLLSSPTILNVKDTSAVHWSDFHMKRRTVKHPNDYVSCQTE